MPSVSEAQRRKDKKITLGWIGWTAGIIDGEGSIGIAKMKRDTVRYTYQARLTVSNSNLRALEKLQELWGGAIKPMRGNSRQKTWRPTFQWTLSGINMKKLLQRIIPYLKIKSEQAKLAIHTQERVGGRKGYTVTHNGRFLCGPRVSDEELFIRENMFQNMKNLNRRGVFDAECIKEAAC